MNETKDTGYLTTCPLFPMIFRRLWRIRPGEKALSHIKAISYFSGRFWGGFSSNGIHIAGSQASEPV